MYEPLLIVCLNLADKNSLKIFKICFIANLQYDTRRYSRNFNLRTFRNLKKKRKTMKWINTKKEPKAKSIIP